MNEINSMDNSNLIYVKTENKESVFFDQVPLISRKKQGKDKYEFHFYVHLEKKCCYLLPY